VRAECRRCLRPESFCVCDLLPTLTPRIRVVILQHPREARLSICSARLTHVALGGSELHQGVRFGDHPRVRELCAAPGTALLFPGPGSTPAADLAASPPATLLVIDGNWPQALKMLRANPAIAALPRVGVVAAAPSSYGGLRREPEAGHLATIDAVAEALAALEREPDKYAPLRLAFRRAVELQLACAQGARRSPRHRQGWRAPTEPLDPGGLPDESGDG
jgi:DTW domain-containing protein YfiP